MPFLLKVIFEDEQPVVFRGWIDSSFGEPLVEDSPFAHADRNGVEGFIVATGRILLLDRADIRVDAILTKGDFLTEASADGDEIPYGRAYCRFVEDYTNSDYWKREIARRLQEITNGEVELIDGEEALAQVRRRLRNRRVFIEDNSK